MNFVFSLLVRHVAAFTLFALGLASYQLGNARPLAPPTPLPAARLRVIITPLANAPVLRVRYENADSGAVRLSLRTSQGELLYTSVLARPTHVRDLNLAAFPVGDYLVEVQTRAARHREIIHLAPRLITVATVVGKEHSELLTGATVGDEPAF